MNDDIFEQLESDLHDLPEDVGTEMISQVKGTQQKQVGDDSNQPLQQSDDANQQQVLDDLYGTSDLTPEQVEQKKKQDNAIKRQMYQKIQQEIQEFRAKKKQEKTEYEIGWQKGTEAARDQEEEQELWEKEQKKAKEKKKDEESITMPGSAQSRSGEQGQVMG
jgi:hypothetical protein